jgi:hypothetical protein
MLNNKLSLNKILFVLVIIATIETIGSFCSPPLTPHQINQDKTKQENYGSGSEISLPFFMPLLLNAKQGIHCIIEWIDIYSDVVMALATIVIALFTYTLYKTSQEHSRHMKESIDVAQKAADAAKKSAEVADKTLASTQRPWIKIVNTRVVGVAPITLMSGGGISIHIGFQFQNIGATPAADVKFAVEVILMDFDPHMYIPEKVRNICEEAKSRDMGFSSQADITGYLFPNETSIEHSISTNFTPASFEKDIGQKIESVKTLLIVVYVLYKSTFDNTVHITGMPYQLTRKDFTPISPAQEDDSFIKNANGMPTDMRSIGIDKLSFEKIWDSYAD